MTDKKSKENKKPKAKKSGKKSLIKKIVISISIILFIGILSGFYRIYSYVYQPNVFLGYKKTDCIYIRTGSNFQDVQRILYEKGMILNRNTFEWLAIKKNYVNHIKPGKYLVKAEMSNNDLINMLRAGNQEPVNLVFNNVRTKEQLAGKVGRQLEADSNEIYKILDDDDYFEKFNLNSENCMAIFIPNTYQLYWNITAKQFVDKMFSEYQKFWTNERKTKAKMANLTPVQVSILASIVQQETNRIDEASRIAGVYINRLKRNMLLQADPTVVFAIGDFSIKRVLSDQLDTDSPYNTYKYAGLPPGPICLPTAKMIDKILNYEHHDYLYFCAKEDFSGYHIFAKTGYQHGQNARKYQKALSDRKIRK